jgi:hypothetical protein
MNPTQKVLSCAAVLALTSVSTASVAADAPIASRWKPQEINYSYNAFTTAYDCDSAASKLKAILLSVGAHPDTKVRANGCANNRPSRNFFVTITTATAVPAADLKEGDSDKAREDLLKRLGGAKTISSAEFPASWKSVELSKDRRLNIRPGDCELIEGLSKRVLPKLGIKIEEERISCTPNQLSVQPPQLRVSALVPLKSPDAKTDAKNEGQS